MKKILTGFLFSTLIGCSALTGIATDAVLGSDTKGMEVTVGDKEGYQRRW